MALRAPDGPVYRRALERLRVDVVQLEHLKVNVDRLLAERAELSEEALRLREDQRRREHEGLDAHVEETCDDAARVVGVERREHEVARQGGLYRDVRRLAVSYFADEHDVGVLSQHRPEDACESKALRDVHMALVHAGQFVFDGVFGRDDVDVRLVQVLEAGVERRRLARASRPSYEYDAVRLVDGELHRLVGVVVEAERGESWREVGLVEDTHDDLLAVYRREYRHAYVDLLLQRLDLEAAVLRAAAFGDVEV